MTAEKKQQHLLYAGTDAIAFQIIMTEIGGISKSNGILLLDPTKDDVDNAFKTISGMMQKKHKDAKRSEFVFYYSGHSDALNDLSFLLIIFFIVIAGFNVNKGFLLNLPSKDKPIVVNTNDILKCELDEGGALFLDGKETKIEELSQKISEKIKSQPNMTFLLTIAPETHYQKVIDVVSTIRTLNVENFSFRMR